LETVVAHLPAGVGLYRGSDLRIQLVNQVFQAIAPGKKMLGQKYPEVWEEVYARLSGLFQHVLETGEPYYGKDDLYMVRRSPDGPLEPRYFSWSLIRVRLPGEEGWGLLNTAIETTDRKQAEEALAKAKAAADASNVAKSQFLANMSHELRTPMNSILGMVELALPNAQDPMVKDCLQTVKGSADLLLTLLNDLLDSAKIDSGKLELESAPFSLREMLDHVSSVLSVRASEKGLRFTCRTAGEAADTVIGDRTRLQQILFNLAGNAIKFTERGEVEIQLHTTVEDGQASLEFAVMDTGIGIPPVTLERLFQPFVQADSSMARRFGGTGLGLSISKRLVELMGGRIWAESELRKGSLFSFAVCLPLAKEAAAERPTPVAQIAKPHGPLRILLAEDNLANQKLAKYILKSRGHVVDVAEDGQKAVDLAAQNSYDVILMDVQMPVMDGLEATAAIRRRDEGMKRVPIIALTAHAMSGDREQCLAAGMDSYLSKPVAAHDLIAVTESVAGGLAAAGDGVR
jgi:signal transduction histidine kinase/ActR/RegA family two-component response regulator